VRLEFYCIHAVAGNDIDQLAGHQAAIVIDANFSHDMGWMIIADQAISDFTFHIRSFEVESADNAMIYNFFVTENENKQRGMKSRTQTVTPQQHIAQLAPPPCPPGKTAQVSLRQRLW
jgi:hypothetical protein